VDNRVLEIVFYLVDHIQERHGRLTDLGDISLDLQGLGYSDDEIASAYSWILEHLQASSEHLYSAFPAGTGSTRILTDLERFQFAPEAHSFLVRLRSMCIIDDEQLEAILERVTAIGQDPITLDQIKLIASSVAFDESGELESDSLFDDEPDSTLRIN